MRVGGEGDFRSYRDMYQNRLQQQENVSKTLKEQQKSVKVQHVHLFHSHRGKEMYDQNLEQMRMFRDLKKLMACKLRSLRSGDQDAMSPLPRSGQPNMLVIQ